MTPQGFLLFVLVIFNMTIMLLFKFSLKQIDGRDLLREKLPDERPAATLPVALIATSPTDRDADVAASAAATSPPLAGPGAVTSNTSFSRVAGMLGAIVLVAFFWALGNVLLYLMMLAPASVEPAIQSVWKYVAAGAVLFAPYAANQISAIFNRV